MAHADFRNKALACSFAVNSGTPWGDVTLSTGRRQTRGRARGKRSLKLSDHVNISYAQHLALELQGAMGLASKHKLGSAGLPLHQGWVTCQVRGLGE